MPTVQYTGSAEPGKRERAVASVIREYHRALDDREDGDVACYKAMDAIQNIFGMRWTAK